MTTKEIKLFATADDIIKAVEGIARKAKTLQEDIHKAAVSACKLYHDKKVEASVFADLINRIQSASPYHANAFSKWVGAFLPLHWADENRVWYAQPNDCEFKGKQFMEARDNPFYKFSPAPQPKPFDMWGELEAIVNKARKHMVKPVEGDNIKLDVINNLVELLKQKEEAKAE